MTRHPYARDFATEPPDYAARLRRVQVRFFILGAVVTLLATVVVHVVFGG